MSNTIPIIPEDSIHPPQSSNPDPAGKLRETLAAIEHERWADWQKWCHQVLWDNVPSHIMQDHVYPILKRWDEQIETPYENLTALEKDSDREQVDRYWHLIDQYTQSKLKAFAGEFEKAIGEEIMCYDSTDISHKFMSCDTCQSNMKNHELRQALKAIKEKAGIV